MRSTSISSSDSGSDSDAGDEDPLASVNVPLPANLSNFISSNAAAVALGKAFFWDEQLGSDAQVACATCHYAIGADTRETNIMHPGPNGIFESVSGPGVTVTPDIFPIMSDDVAGSQGVANVTFEGIVPGEALEMGTPLVDPVFGTNRLVTGRNTPTAINVIFTDENFWDGRARNHFNGMTPGGAADAMQVLHTSGDTLALMETGLFDASTASQATGPPLSEVEMSFVGRRFLDIAQKMLPLRPLALQDVHVNDSSLDARRHMSGKGLVGTYTQMIQEAFHPEFWDSDILLDANQNMVGSGLPTTGETFSLMESNFTLFWGLAILAYEATLVSDDTKFDRVAAGTETFTPMEALGFEVFEGEGRCDHCHRAPEFTNAAITNGGNGNAFAHIGVRPADIDPGAGEGEFKTPSLRNIELTGPYFHNGSRLTLRQVVEFYDGGGDFPSDMVDSQIRELELSDTEKEALIHFMLTLTDERVRVAAEPFDHPSLTPANSVPIPATGRNGGASATTFLGASPFDL